MTPEHATITLLDHATSTALVDAVITGAPLPVTEQPGETVWLLATARDGLITGHHLPDLRTWARSTDATNDGVGTLTHTTLLSVRLFGDTSEILLRATPTGSWRGRVLTDTAASTHEPTMPLERDLLLARDHVTTTGGFHRVRTRSGLSHVVPPAWTARDARLVVRDYLAIDPDTGQARICCSRCVDIRTCRKAS